MSLNKVPERFLGFAFTVADILLELDDNFTVLNSDGAISVLSKEKNPLIMGKNISELLSEDEFSLFKISIKGLAKASRIGPFFLKFGDAPNSRIPLAVFAGRLPMMQDKIYLSLSYPYRLGMDLDQEEDLTDTEKKDRFLGKLDNLLERSAAGDEHLMVTILETVQETELTQGKQQEMEKFLKSFSVGGNSASKVGENKFALVHEKGEEENQPELIMRNVEQAVGLAVTGASIDAKEMVEDQDPADAVKALVFSLQQFSEGADNFNIDNFKSGGGSMIAETSKKVNLFRKMLSDGDFEFVYQPIVSFRSGTTHHFEALSRFNIPGVNSNQFEMICFAEDVGMIMDFDMSVLKRTIEDLKPQMGRSTAPRIAVNVSGKSLSNAKFIAEMIEILAKTPSLARYISIEVTESSKIHDLEKLNRILAKIREIGYKVYLDDFGAGASGFQYLKQLQVDGVKIDGEYVRDAVTNKVTRAFLMSMVTLCQNIGVDTVAEWVEEKEQFDLLLKLGINYGQGYYFGKPSKSLTPTRARGVGG